MFTDIDKITMFKIINIIYDKFPNCVEDKETKGIFYINFSNFGKDIYNYVYDIMNENIQKREEKEKNLKEKNDFNYEYNYNEFNYINNIYNNNNTPMIKERKNIRRFLRKKLKRSNDNIEN